MPAACMILREAEDAFDELAQAAAEPTGTLRITAPNDYGTAVVAPVVAAFAARYPACQVEQTLSDQTMDLISGQIDMAIRVGWLDGFQPPGAQDRYLPAIPGRRAGLRGPDRGGPRSGGRAKLPFVANMALRDPLLWQFSRGDLDRRAVRMQARHSHRHDAGGARGGSSRRRAFGSAGFPGGGRTGIGAADPHPPGMALPSGGIHAVYPAARFRPRKVTAFVEMLIAAEQRKGSVAEGVQTRGAKPRR